MTLRETLEYPPVELSFGTSGLRGLVADLSQLEAYVNTRGFLAWLRRRRLAHPGDPVYCAGDLRPSTDRFVSGGRGEILQAVVRAVEDSGLRAEHLGRIPSPALMHFACRRRAASVMVTGSHIPFERNGIKYNTPTGEVLKNEERPILAAVAAMRAAEYERAAAESLFDPRGMFKPEQRRPLPPESPDGRAEYLRRYFDAFPADLLAGARILVWQHSAVGRDLLVELLQAMGAEVFPAGRSDAFVPIDTEAVDERLLATVQALVDGAVAAAGGAFDAVVSTDGDGDRPLLLAVADGRVRFLPGDLVGLLAADFLGARAVTVPVSASDAVDLFFRERGVVPRRTRIGSPYVIAALREVGWEGNGGFLTAVPLRVPGGGVLEPLATRDALLPILCVLASSQRAGLSVGALLDRLPRRFGSSALLRPFPRERFQPIALAFAPPRTGLLEARFPEGGRVSITGRSGGQRGGAGSGRLVRQGALLAGLRRVRQRLEEAFRLPEDSQAGFATVAWLNWLDGLRVGFANGQIAHLRASGNAPELRVYAVAGSQEAADRVVERVLRGGVLTRLERLAEEHRAVAAFAAAPRPLLLRGEVQHYAWGGSRFIPELLCQPNDLNQPWAELWLGTHSRAPAAVRLEEAPGGWLALDRLIRAAPEAVLGRSTTHRFGGELPYLLKVLDARETLSIQVHPTREQARAGFTRENDAGVAVDSPERSFPDPNPKPEVHAALSELWMLHGFRPPEEIAAALETVPELGVVLAEAAELPGLSERLRRARAGAAARTLLRELYTRLMTLPQETVDAALNPLLARLSRREPLAKSSPDFWALRASRQHPLPGGHRDRGLFSIYLLNLVRLEPGQGTFQPAGLPHAYLEGTTVELLTNSDNVLRGGLTRKKVDVPELLRTLEFTGGKPSILSPHPVSATEGVYPAPVRAFRLSRLRLAPGQVHRCPRHGPDCLLAVQGAAELECAGRRLELARGHAALVPAGLPYALRSAGAAWLYRASVPGADFFTA